MINLSSLWRRRRRYKVCPAPRPPRLLIPRSVVAALQEALEPARQRGHEGVAFLLGYSAPGTAVGLHAVRPQARTSRGSFFVPAADMAQVMGLALDLDLQLVAQVHTCTALPSIYCN